MLGFTLYPDPGYFWPLCLVVVTTFFLGVFVLYRARRSHSAISFSLFCFFAALWGASYALGNLGSSPALTTFAAYGTVLAALPIPLLFFLLCASFPDRRMPFNPPQLWLLALPSLALLASLPTGQLIEASVLADGALLIKLGYFHIFYLINILFYFLAGIVVTGLHYRQGNAYEKLKYRYFFAGLLLASVTGYSFSLFLPMFKIYQFVHFGPLGTIFLVGFTTYAISRYRLMSISMAVKKTTAYSLVTSGITFTYVLVVVLFESIFRTLYGYYSFWASVPAALVIAVTFMPVRGRLQKVTDEMFFRRTIEYQKVIKSITHMISSVTDLHTLFRLIDRTIVRIMCIRNASVLLLEEKEDQYVVEKTNGLPDVIKDIRLALDDPLVVHLKEKADAAVLDELKSRRQNAAGAQERKELDPVIEEMERFEAHASIPSFLKGKLVGILNLGEKLSGEPYSPDDLELLLTMASEAAIAIENAKLYRDITQTRDYLNSLVQGSDDAIITLDLEGKVLSWNKGAEKIFGYSYEELAGKVHSAFLESENQQLVGQVLQGGSVSALEVRIRNKEGSEIPLLLTLSPIKDAGGSVMGISAILKDITELKKVEQLKHEFLSVVSHELRTPLTPIKGYLSLLIKEHFGKLQPKQKEALTIIVNQSNHLHDLIDSVIDISRIEADKPLELDVEPVFMEEIATESINSYASSFAAKGIRVKTSFPASRASLMADRKKLMRVMDNLLGNALKFTPAKGVVSVLIQRSDDHLEVAVADTGIGLAPGHLKKVFERFYQVDTSYTRSSGGIGMGLTIAAEIVETHGGRIRAESDGPGKGTRIRFTIPFEIQKSA